MGISGANAIEEGWSEESILVIIIGVERQIAKRGGRLYDGDIHNQRKPQHLELVCLKKILIKEKCIKKCMNLLGKKTPKTTTFPSCGSISTSLTNWNEQNMFGK